MSLAQEQINLAGALVDDLTSWGHEISVVDLLDCLANIGLRLIPDAVQPRIAGGGSRAIGRRTRQWT